MRVLLIEDHKPLLKALQRGLEEEGFAVDIAEDGEVGEYKGRTASYDAVVLDLMLPKKDGLTVLKEWRKAGVKTHVLLLTAKDTTEDKVTGLDLGADDYLTKPFQDWRNCWPACTHSFAAAIRSKDPQLRIFRIWRSIRPHGQTGRAVQHISRARVCPAPVSRLPPGQSGDASMIWEHLYDEYDENTSNVVDVYIRYLRPEIDKGFETPLILTRWGEGRCAAVNRIEEDRRGPAARRSTPMHSIRLS